ncbi:MAG: SDR family oxidoreductase [Candidatus Omnitrophica bacterium]|nr:SDR family oxidoreductase [Candidatus Omnitrophota bacterium]
MVKNKVFFLTGATGLIGSYLLKTLLANGCIVHVVARSGKGRKAEERVLDALHFWGDDSHVELNKNLFVWEGDITSAECGLSSSALEALIPAVDEIVHCAAAIEFHLSWEQIYQINVFGTQQVLDIALRCQTQGKSVKCNHLSTAFICGKHSDTFSENDFDVGQEFNTNYEKSKFQAEKIVREYREQGLWVDIFRPAFVVGESATGKTFRFQHLYQILQLWNREVFDIFPITGDRPVNMVTVDAVAGSLYAILDSTTVLNGTYHLFPQTPVFLKKFLEIASQLIGFKKPRLCTWPEFDASPLTPVQKAIINMNSLYFISDPQLSSDYTGEALKKIDYSFPEIDDEMLARLIQYVITSNFIKPKSPQR